MLEPRPESGLDCRTCALFEGQEQKPFIEGEHLIENAGKTRALDRPDHNPYARMGLKSFSRLLQKVFQDFCLKSFSRLQTKFKTFACILLEPRPESGLDCRICALFEGQEQKPFIEGEHLIENAGKTRALDRPDPEPYERRGQLEFLRPLRHHILVLWGLRFRPLPSEKGTS